MRTRSFLDWIKETSGKRNKSGHFELNALSKNGTKGVLVGDLSVKQVVDADTAFIHQVYPTSQGTLSWDFTLNASTKSLKPSETVSLSGFYRSRRKTL